VSASDQPSRGSWFAVMISIESNFVYFFISQQTQLKNNRLSNKRGELAGTWNTEKRFSLFSAIHKDNNNASLFNIITKDRYSIFF
jgi:hypothetical protein